MNDDVLYNKRGVLIPMLRYNYLKAVYTASKEYEMLVKIEESTEALREKQQKVMRMRMNFFTRIL